jgi:hypothetical protein
MAKTHTPGDGARTEETAAARKLKEKEEKIRKMAGDADKRSQRMETLFPAEPVPGLVLGDNPQGRYEAWYKGWAVFRKAYLPGKPYKLIRDEVNAFMKEGKRRGADSRMATQPLMEEAIAQLRKWLVEGGGQDTVNLYLIFRDLNKKWDSEVEIARDSE